MINRWFKFINILLHIMVDDTFIIDYDTLDTILDNSTRICKENKLCKKCEKEIVNHYAESCKVFEYTILLNRQKNKNVKKTPYGCTYYFYDEVDIINDFLVNFKVIKIKNL